MMESLSDIDSIKRRMIEALHEAAAHFSDDRLFYKKAGIPENRLRKTLDGVVDDFAKEVSESPVVRNGDDLRVPTRRGILMDRSHLHGADYYIIIPISKTTDNRDIYNCLLSIIHNFEGHNYSLIIVLNQVEKNEIKFLKERGISHVIFESDETISLPNAYNLAVEYLRNELSFREGIISFMDDDAFIIGKQQKEITANVAKLKGEDPALMTSGHYYDTRCLPSYFFESIKMTNDFHYASLVKKPYCHGGAFLSMNIKNYPEHGLTTDGLGGINLSILQINNVPDRDLDKTTRTGKWFLYNNPNLRVFHRLKENIIQWTATYLSYELAWNYGLGQLDAKRSELWREKLRDGSMMRYDYLSKIAAKDEESLKFAIGCILLTKYYKPLLKQRFKYQEFKDLIRKRHTNLK